MMHDREKWARLERLPKSDAQDTALVRVARSLWFAASGVPKTFAHLAMALARDAIRYQLDTDRVGGEDIAGVTRAPAPALEALRRGVDDCDAKARLFVALCLAVRVPAKLVPVWKADMLQHVSAAVQLGGAWLPVELTLSRARLGESPAQVPTEKNGVWLRT